MLKSFKITNFRGFKSFQIKDFSRLNLIAGKNNTGKTALLEALFLHAGSFNPSLAITINALRGIQKMAIQNDPAAEMPWNSLFYEFNPKSVIELDGQDENGRRILVTLSSEPISSAVVPVQGTASNLMNQNALVLKYIENKKKEERVTLKFTTKGLEYEPVFPLRVPAIFVSARSLGAHEEDAARFGQLTLRKEEEQLLGALQEIEPRLKSVTVVYEADSPTLHGDIGQPRLVPLLLMGEGMVRLAKIVLAISSSRNGIVFIDEIETGFHYSVMKSIWRGLSKIADTFNVQLFATTHSLECTRAAYTAFQNEPKFDLMVYRLDGKNSAVNAIAYDKESLGAALEADLEIR